MTKSKSNLYEGPIFKQLVVFIIPILLTGVLQQLFNTADVILAGRLGTSGNDAVAAVGSTTALTSLLINFFMGCSTGSAVAVSHAIGSKNSKEVKQTVHTAMLLALVLGAFLTVSGILFSKSFLTALSTPPNLIDRSTAYLQTYFTGMVPYMIYYFGAAILRTNGETKKPLYFLLAAGPIKLLLTVVFVSVLNLDVVGLALATTCSQTVAAVLILIEMFKRNDEFKLTLSTSHLSGSALGKILKLGIPSGVQSATFSFSSVIIQYSANSLSYLPGFLIGNSAACSIETFANVITTAFYQASISFVGQNVGARRLDRVKRMYWIFSLVSTVMIACVSLFVCVFAKQLLGLYIVNSADAITWGTLRVFFIFIPLIFQGLMDVTSGTLRGMGISIPNTVVALVFTCGFRILWCMTVFPIERFHTPQILFLSYPLSWFITYLMQFTLFAVLFRKLKRDMMQSN